MNKANEITIKLNEEEFNSIREFAKSKSLEIEEAVKMTVLELIEEEKQMKDALAEIEKLKEEGAFQLSSPEEIWKRLGI